MIWMSVGREGSFSHFAVKACKFLQAAAQVKDDTL
jgi:hypothetical protein